MRKAQTEILGLLVIVILIAAMLFFVVWLRISGTDTPQHISYQQDQYAFRFVGLLLATDTPCGEPLSSYVRDCARGDTRLCQGVTSCTFTESTVKGIFQETLEKWYVPYQFTISQTPLNWSWGNCTANKQAWRVGEQAVPVSRGGGKYDTILISLRLCR